jgi:hypothetical protein
MEQNTPNQPKAVANPQVPQPRRPNDTGAVGVECTVKVFDPNSKKVFVEQQA